MTPRATVAQRRPGAVRFAVGDATLEVTALAPDVFRLGFFPARRRVEYESEATAGARWEPVEAESREEDGRIEIVTAQAQARIALHPLRVAFADRAGGPFVGAVSLSAGAPGSFARGPAALIGPPVRLDHARSQGTRFFGCGERTSGLEKTGSRQVFWNIDPPQGHSAPFNHLYKSNQLGLSLQDG